MYLSIVVATFNRSMYLHNTLSDLAVQKTNASFKYEIIVADNNSTDDTKKVVAAFGESTHVPIRYVFEGNPGKPAALNAGLRGAIGEYIAFVDDDVQLQCDWLLKIYETFMMWQADGVGGPVKPLLMGDRASWLSDKIVRQLGIFDLGPQAHVVTDRHTAFIGPNCAYRRAVFEKIGGYDVHRVGNSDDVNVFYRAFDAGFKLVYNPEIEVFHKLDCSRITKKYLAKRFFNQGRAMAYGAQEEPSGRRLFRIPLWVLRFFLKLHFDAMKAWLKGDKDAALWHWLERYFYLGEIYYCFMDWFFRRPLHHGFPVINFPKALQIDTNNSKPAKGE